MNREDILSGKAGLAGIQQAINGQASRRQLRSEVQTMLREGYRAGPFELTRAKFKPGRKLSAYFNFPVLDAASKAIYLVHLAVTWQNSLEDSHPANDRDPMQEEANRAGLMPVQSELWRDLPDQGMRLQLWPLDPKFPRLVRLGNPSHVASLLASLDIPHNSKHLPVITPIRYRPGERHVLRYEVSDSAGKQRLYAKLYTNEQDAARAFGVANRVVDWLDANNRGLHGNRPEAISLENCAILYPHAPGIPLSHQLKRSRRWVAAQLRTIGAALTALHDSPSSLQADLKQNTLSKEAKIVRRASEHIQILLPEVHDKVLRILNTIEEQYSRLPQEEPTFTHSDFKSDHLLSTPRGLTLIDFDTCTLTDPALDVGKFLADLEWWFALKGISGVEGAQAEVLDGYRGNGSGTSQIQDRLRRAKLFHVLIFVKIIARRVPIYKKGWGTMTSQMIERAAQVLDKAIEF